MPNPTHCLPTGALQTAEIATCNIADGSVQAFIPAGGVGLGNIRGIVVFLQGLCTTQSPYSIPPVLPADITQPGISAYFTTFKNSLVADGWIFLVVPSNEWSSYPVGSQAIFNAVNADAGHGSNYLLGLQHWWTHVVQYCNNKWTGMPIVPFGVSWGGFEVLNIASLATSTVIAAGCHVPASSVGNIAPPFSQPVSLGTINCTGISLPATVLASVSSIPMIVGYGTNDEALGFGVSTVAAGFTTAAAGTVTSLPLTSASGMLTAAGITVATSGGAGYATYTVTVITTNTLTVTFLSGSGNVVAGASAVQNAVASIVSNAPANVVGNSTADTHEFTLADSNFYSGTWFGVTVDALAPKKF